MNSLLFSIIVQRQDFFLIKSYVLYPWPDSLVCPWCLEAQQGRARHSGGEALSVLKLSNSSHPQLEQMERPGSPGCTEGQEREARGNAASPQLKTEGRVLLCFWLRNRRGISPATSPYVGPTSMEGNRLQNHRGNKSAMRTATLLKMPEGSSFGQEATPEVMGARADLLKTMPRPYGAVSWGLQQPVMNPFKRLHVSITALERSASRGLLTQVISSAQESPLTEVIVAITRL